MPSESPKPLDTMLKHASENKLSPREALDLERALRAEPSPDGVYAPITLIGPDTMPPAAYVMHIFTTKCLGCGTEHRHSEVYHLNHIRMPNGTFTRHMVPVSKPEWNVPLKIHNLTTKTTPMCWECTDDARAWLRTLPIPPAPQSISKLTPKPEPAKATEGSTAQAAQAPKKPKSKTFTVDDLLD